MNKKITLIEVGVTIMTIHKQYKMKKREVDLLSIDFEIIYICRTEIILFVLTWDESRLRTINRTQRK